MWLGDEQFSHYCENLGLTPSVDIPLHDPDPLHEKLLDDFRIQVPVWQWPSPRGRYIRISAQLYNHLDEYQYLAEVLQSIELT